MELQAAKSKFPKKGLTKISKRNPFALTPPSPPAPAPAPLCLVVFLFGGNPRHKNDAPQLGSDAVWAVFPPIQLHQDRGVGGEGKGIWRSPPNP
jgi:hypothetical protein